ncbi:hypothetical protein CLV92_111111 [Kineococcus xinjiangensis]|uniref:Tyr recombinase domain-containing protein n=1 Tax=Kineococcus xinjiangensis TaxID=512762 RepID=A0A2S6IG45_9ACTN|nr:hypothetical protein [Kineococcus xinjiangensis]PPK93194.1 hypothetical protein CLV92_111111 [Kineococcus xinjiangensis]
MTETPAPPRPTGVRTVADAGGRARFEVPWMRRSAVRAAATEEALGAVAGVRTARAHPLTGGVVVHYDPAVTDVATLAVVLERAAAGAEAGTEAPRTEHPADGEVDAPEQPVGAVAAGAQVAGAVALRDRAAFELARATALPRSELAALDVSDVHCDDTGLLVLVRRPGSPVEVRVLRTEPGGDAAVDAVEAWWERRAAAGSGLGPLFPALTAAGRLRAPEQGGSRLSATALRRIVVSVAARLGAKAPAEQPRG